MRELVLASGNRGKLRELSALLENVPVMLRPQSDFDLPDAIEDGLSFVENAIIKARHAAACTGRPALADDSGIAVDALGGAPGIYSARYAGEDASDTENLEKLLTEAADVPDDQRRCRFICIAAFLRHESDPVPIVCQGMWEGRLLREPRGQHGFGYDPVFWVKDRNSSSAELLPEVKNKISHRAVALTKMVAALQVEFVVPLAQR